MEAEISPLEEVRAALDAAAEAVEEVRFPLGDDTHPGAVLVARLLWTIRGYLIPRLGDLDAPLVAVLIGSTGSGKSTLVNSLAGASISPTSVLRPTTTAPVVWCHRDHADRYLDGPLASLEPRVVPSVDPLVRNLTVIDAPDVDSVETSHRAIADALLNAADVCVFITTPQRYADAVPWEFLRQAHARDVPLLYVLNRTRTAIDPAVIDDFVNRMRAGGLDAEFDEVIPIPEQEPSQVHGGLPEDAVLHVRSILAELADVDAGLAVSQATVGAFEDVVAGLVRVERIAADDEQVLSRLRRGVTAAADAQKNQLETSLAAGTLLKGEIVNHWSDLVAGGQVSKVINEGLRKVRGWHRRTLGGGADRIEGEARNEVAAIIARHVDLAASEAATSWNLDPLGRTLVEVGFWRASPDTYGFIERTLEDWSLDVRRLVEEKGGDRHAIARAASVGVNAVAVLAMLAVFSHSAGITGSEVGIAAGAAAAQQVILEKVFGGAAMRTLLTDARQRLVDAIGACFDHDLGRFGSALDRLRPTGVEAAREAALSLNEVRGAFNA